jgi:chromosome partitioning protein
MIDEETSINDCLKKTEIRNLQICTASIDLSATDVELSSKIGREYILRNKLKEVAEDFDYIFIDCPPSLGLLTVNALTASDYAYIPLQCEFYSLEGLSYLLNTVKLVKDNLNDNIEIGGVLLTMYDRRNKVTKQVEAEVRDYFGDDVMKTVIPRNVKLSEAPSHGKPGILYDHRSTGAKAYMILAREMLKRFG